MFERFSRDARQKIRRAAELAEAEGAAMVEVEHLFTALVDPVTDKIGRGLVSAGVIPQHIRSARDREFRSALALAGVATERSVPSAAPRLRRGRTARFAPSAKLALERTLEVAVASGHRRITDESLLLAIIGTPVGIMPRLLDELGTSPSALKRAVRADP
jgi:ATP-dependent Clp protease ATP-binding subunit ClpA